jgi:hypothetical protein
MRTSLTPVEKAAASACAYESGQDTKKSSVCGTSWWARASIPPAVGLVSPCARE